jgi:hypothetical protein
MPTITYHNKRIRLTDRMFSLPGIRYGPDKEGIAAVKRLEKAGLVEIREYSNHYRINPTF